MIRRKASEPQGLEQCFELQQDFSFATTKDRGQHLACVGLDGMPQPALVALLADTTPQLVALSFPSLLHVHDELCWIYGTQQRGMDRCEGGCFFLSARSTVSVLMRNTRAVSRIPLALRLMAMICCFTSGNRPC